MGPPCLAGAAVGERREVCHCPGVIMETLKLLVIDDEAVVRRSVESALRGFRVHVPEAGSDVRLSIEHAATGEEALERFASGMPDILLLDQNLPGINGLEVLNRVTAMQTGMVTIMITAYGSIEMAVTATRGGAYDFLTKPFTPKDLRNAVHKAVIRVLMARQARRMEEEKRQVRFQFIRVLGHELKAPLNAIDGYLQMMTDRSSGSDIAAYDHAITRSQIRVDHMRKLIADLLDITRIESGVRGRELRPVDLREIARLSIETMTPDAHRRGIRIDLHAEAPVPLVADRGEVEMISNNLVSNAVKYNRDGGCVDVFIARENSRVTIRVVDTGIGLAPEDAARLFSEFIRIRTREARDVPGSGLGLSIVRKLAQLYGGDATVESTPGVGSTFTVSLADAPMSAGSPESRRALAGERNHHELDMHGRRLAR